MSKSHSFKEVGAAALYHIVTAHVKENIHVLNKLINEVTASLSLFFFVKGNSKILSLPVLLIAIIVSHARLWVLFGLSFKVLYLRSFYGETVLLLDREGQFFWLEKAGDSPDSLAEGW